MTHPLTREEFGRLPDGRVVEAITLSNRHGMTVRVITLGAAIQSVLVPDRAGQLADVTLGHNEIAGYLATRDYFGATVGRYANRIADGRFVLDGKSYEVPPNNGLNALHGGPGGFDQQLWAVLATNDGAIPSVTLGLSSPDGDQGFPGNLAVTATYALDDDDVLKVDYRAATDRPTIVNISNHAYWNLAGEGSPDGAMGHRLLIPAEYYLPTDEGAIPTGEFRSVAGTPFDFREAQPIGARVRDASDPQIAIGKGYDHNWVVARQVADTPRLLARLEEPHSGRALDVLSTQPGIQFYSGNFLDGTVAGKSGRLYRQGDAVALEPQLFPDTPNRPDFGSARLDPGQAYCNLILFRFGLTRN